MSVLTQFEPRYDATRIPVDSVVLYRAEEMEDFELCPVLSVSTAGLEVLLTQPVANRALFNMAVRDEGAGRRFYREIGEVDGCEQVEDGWLHWVAPLPRRQWLSKFLYDVVCSTPDSTPTLAERYRVSRGAGLDAADRGQLGEPRDVGWNVVQFPARLRDREFSLY